ncbi:MAG: ornithine cyclodeaminase family protein [Holophaga sp.]|jgi:ornithine cyclodeaminase/alanine dehydrogenase
MEPDLLFLTRSDIAAVLTLGDCLEAMEEAFRMRAEGRALAPGLMHTEADGGEFHVKGGGLRLDRTWFALKANGGFFHNRERFGLPNILGLILLFDGSNGRPVAVMDSSDITALRTGATTALAARHLARADAATVTICGCGRQGAIQARSLLRVLPSIRRIQAWDRSPEAATAFVAGMADQPGVEAVAVADLPDAVLRSDVVVTCTPAKGFFLRKDMVRPGTFISAVGADSPDKQEIEPALVASATLVVDILEQCARVGELHHALEAGLMTPAGVHGELGDVVAGKVPGRTREDQITLFDTTGSALQDAAAAVAAYRKALALGVGLHLDPRK